jgi:hypothetical protein
MYVAHWVSLSFMYGLFFQPLCLHAIEFNYQFAFCKEKPTIDVCMFPNYYGIHLIGRCDSNAGNRVMEPDRANFLKMCCFIKR